MTREQDKKEFAKKVVTRVRQVSEVHAFITCKHKTIDECLAYAVTNSAACIMYDMEQQNKDFSGTYDELKVARELVIALLRKPSSETHPHIGE